MLLNVCLLHAVAYFPFTREELKRHDPEMFALLARLWRVEPQEPVPTQESQR